MEHRWGERLKVALQVRIGGPGGLLGRGLAVNLSVSGAFIATSVPIPLLSRVRISFAPPSRPTRWRLEQHNAWSFEGQVVRRNAAGFAVEWCEFGTDELVALADSSRQRPKRESDQNSRLASWTGS